MAGRVVPRPSVLCCLPSFREPGSGELTGGLVSSFHVVRALAAFASVGVLSLDPQPPSPALAERFGYRWRSHPRPVWRRGRAYLRWRAFLRGVMHDAIRQWGMPDVVVATTSTIPVLDMIHGPKGVALVQAFENFGWRVPGGTAAERWQGLRLDALGGFRNRRALRGADLVIVNSCFMASRITRVFRSSRVEVLYPCLDLTSDDAAPAAGRGAKPAVGFVHRTAAKNLEFVRDLARLMPDVDFLVFGPPPPDRPALPNLIFRGWVTDRVRMFAEAPVWIVPSRWQEPFGRVAAEALVLGRRALVANTGGLPEATGELGQVMGSLDLGAWALAIREALARPLTDLERQAIGTRLTAKFGRDVHDRRVRELFARLVTG